MNGNKEVERNRKKQHNINDCDNKEEVTGLIFIRGILKKVLNKFIIYYWLFI